MGYPSARSGWVTPLARTGVPPWPGMGYPPARTGVPPAGYTWKGYAAGGMLLAVSHRRTFLLVSEGKLSVMHSLRQGGKISVQNDVTKNAKTSGLGHTRGPSETNR